MKDFKNPSANVVERRNAQDEDWFWIYPEDFWF
jgi:hypothetical protein